jgi:Hemerythrin HHE cation binding domain
MICPTKILSSAVAAATALMTMAAGVAAQRAQPSEGHMHTLAIHIPESIRAEHAEIHSALVAATQAPGRVGAAAKELAAVLHPHFVREEQIALPPLGLLQALARGEFTPEMRDVLPMTDSLRAELPRMLEEHKAIRAATERLGDAARAEKNAAVARLAEQLVMHARSEEEVFYPTAVLVGDVVRSRLPASP